MISLFKRFGVRYSGLAQRIRARLGLPGVAKTPFSTHKKIFAYSRAAILLTCLGVTGTQAITVSSTPATTSCVWAADAYTLYQIQTETNVIAQSVSLKNINAIATNGSDCGVWALAGRQLYKFDRNAQQLLNITLRTLEARFSYAELLAIDPYDDSVWLANGKMLTHIGENGQLIGSSTVPGNIEQIVAGLDRSVWLLGNKQLWHYDRQGNLLSSRNLHGTVHPKPKHLAVDSLGGVLWLAGAKELTRIDLAQPSQPALNIDLPHQAEVLAINPLSGDLWAVTADDQLSRYSRGGSLLYTGNLRMHNLRNIKQLAFDPITQSLWMGSSQALGRFSADGEFVARLSGKDAVAALSTPAFMLNPALSLVRPPQSALTNNAQPTITYRYDAVCNSQPCALTADYFSGHSINATLNQNPIGPFNFDNSTGQASYTPPSRLPEGVNTLSAQARDPFGNPSNIANDQFTVDTIAPSFISVTPSTGSVLTSSQVTLQGVVDDIAASVILDGVGQATNTSVSESTLSFSFPVTLTSGQNILALSAIDRAGNVATHDLTLTFNPPAPGTPVAANITVGSVAGGNVTLTGSAGAVGAGLKVAVTNTRTQQTLQVNADGAGSFTTTIAAQAGDLLTVRAINQWGTTSATAQFTVTSPNTTPTDPDSGPGVIPPDPASLAPPIDRTVSTNIATSTAFLYTGPNAIQTGVASGTIEARRVAIMRGKVMDREGNALSAVRVRVLNHPELGQTHSRADGMFDIAVNGGGHLTLSYTKAGYLPVQRTVKTPWRDFVTAEDVAMIPLDAQVTTVDLSSAASMQVARGSAVSDQDGTRQATLLFAPGTTATMVLVDGTTQPLHTLSVRATEYTFGPNGPKTMPGPLPPTSGYTYAVELSVDEAITAGAKTVRFSQPVMSYTDNFLNFPVGGIVPAGYYDREKATWIPAPNGRVIKLVAVNNGIADLDVNGSGTAADAAALAQLGISESERQQLANLYQPGQSFWRVPIDHFTPWDYNWPYGPPDAASPPNLNPAIEVKNEDPCEKNGSIIECQNQVLGERVSIVGSPFTLNYRNDRVPGRTASNMIQIPLTSAVVNPDLKRIEVELTVAGQHHTESFSAAPDQTLTFIWDGKDAYGRQVQGRPLATIRIGNVYDAVYRTPAQFPASFAAYPGPVLKANRARQEMTLWQELQRTVGAWDARGVGLGGWTLDIHHTYDVAGQTVFFGDGRQRSDASIQGAVKTIAGSGPVGFGSGAFSGDGGLATAAGLTGLAGVAIDSKGNVFITDGCRIRKVDPQGIIATIAGTGACNGEEEGPAMTTMVRPNRIVVDNKDNLFFSSGDRVFKLGADGHIAAVAGNGSFGKYSGEGGPATEAVLGKPWGIAVDPQGNLYIADLNHGRVFKVDTDGIIRTIAGTGPKTWWGGDGGPAVQAQLAVPAGLALDKNGNLFVSEWGSARIRKITPDGIISTVAGIDDSTFSGDGGPATEAGLGAAYDIAIDRDGNLLVSDDAAVRRINAQGIITTIAGGKYQEKYGFGGDGGPAVAARFQYIAALAVDADNRIYLADSGNNRIRRIAKSFPEFGTTEIVIPSEDGSRLYRFDESGRHLQTLHALTGAVLHQFAYDAQGQLAQVTDGDGNLIRIERDSSGQPTAIVAPDGQRTALTLDTNGYLTALVNPADETTGMAYGTGGLLTAFTNPRNQTTTMTYDGAAHLIQDQNAAGGFWQISRNEMGSGTYEISMSTALGRTNRYKVERLATGDTLHTNTEPDGSAIAVLQKTDGSIQTTTADGMVVTSVEGPDPRFGMHVPLTVNATVKTPSGLTSTTARTRQTALGNPTDLFSIITETDTVTVNGQSFTTIYDAGQRQYTSATPLGRQTVIKTDAQGRPVRQRITGIQPVDHAYDARGRLTSITQGGGADARTVSYVYNPQGYVDSVTDALNRNTRYGYDAAGRVTSVTLPDSRVIGFSYDANGNVTSVTPPSRPAHGFDYDAVDLATGYTPPALSSQTVATRYEYNLDKQPVKIIRPDGKTVDYGYNSGGRLATLTMPSGVVNYGYTANSGQLASVTTAGGIGLAYSYDGSLLTGTAFSGPVAGSVGTTYDNFFRVSQLGVNGSNIAFGYDNDGLLTSAGGLTLTRDAGNGLVSGSALGQITTSHNYDSFGQPASFRASLGAAVLYEEQYARDKAGRLTQKTVNVGGQTSVYSYAYDAAGRFTEVTKDGSPAGHFEYDANGNRTLAYGIAAGYDDQDRLVDFGGAQYSYTANGELKQIVVGANVTDYEYDVFGNLTHVALPGSGALDYLVDGRNRRIGKKVNGTLVQGFLYQDQLKPAAELDGQGNVTARFVYAGKANVPEYLVKGGVTYRIITDQLGSVRLVVDSTTGQIAQRIDYDDWGNVLSDSNPGFQPFGFAGGLYDRDTGLVRFGARDYSAQIGRWTAKDPIGFAGGDTNLLAYVGNDPVNFFDPFGLDAIPNPNGVVPGGPWTPAGPGQAPGTFYGPQKSSGGRDICRYVPSEANGGPKGAADPYWKTQDAGQKGWNRYDSRGNPITPNQAHPGPRSSSSSGGGGGSGHGTGGVPIVPSGTGGGWHDLNPFKIPYS